MTLFKRYDYQIGLLLKLMLVILAIPAGLTAAEVTIIDPKNEFDGQTIQTVYTKSDREFKLERKVEYFDRNKILRKVLGIRQNNDYNKLKVEQAIEFYSVLGQLERVEVRFRAEKVRETGYSKVVTYYRPQGMLSKKEVYYTQSDFADQIYSKSVDFFEINGEKSRSEFILSDQEFRRTGYHKLITYYANGKVIRQELYDKNGVVF